MKLVTVLLLASGVAALAAPAAAEVGREPCSASPLSRDSAPRDPAADPVGPADWYINADRTIWAGPVPAGGWSSGGILYSGRGVVPGQKTYWVRPQGTPLVITGRRIDGPTAALEANVPCCYRTGFQIVALHFPTAGCWEVSAKAGDRELTFVTEVNTPRARLQQDQKGPEVPPRKDP
jgi:hypothetical protein